MVGSAGTAPTQAVFDAAGVSGKIALIGVSANANYVTMAKNAGAIGLMGFSTALGGRGNHASASSPSVTAGTDIPVVGLARCHGEWLMAMIAKDVVSLDIQTERIATPNSWNAIGVKPAKNDPENAPILFISSHIDSVMAAPGANDSASGIAVTVEAARAFAFLDTDDVEIRFVGYGSEESGLVGANRYIARMDAAERARVLGVFQMDMTGSKDEERAKYWCMMTVDGRPNIVTDTFMATGQRLGYGATLEQGQFSSSDHVPFHNAGIPAAMGMWFGRPAGYTGMITPSNYTIEACYHTPLDTIEDNVSELRMKMCIEVVTAAVYDMALKAKN
jgi:aminopeptidase YwaD